MQTVSYVFPFTMGVFFADRLICFMNILYMELSYTGSLDQSTKPSEHVNVQIGKICKATAGYCVVQSCRFFKLCKLLVTYSLSLWVWIFWQTNLFHERAVYGTKLHWFMDQSTKASEHIMFQIGNTYNATAFNNCVVQSCRLF